MHKVNVLDYKKPAPRYDTYPHLSFWNDKLEAEQWLAVCEQTLSSRPEAKLSIYIHLPFCQSLCSYCACNTYIIHRDHKHEQPHPIEESYLQSIHQEFSLYQKSVPALRQSQLVSLYLGGGTPNFFSPTNLGRLIQPLLQVLTKGKNYEFSVEMDPRYSSRAHCQVLYDLGFRHIRFGIEDFHLDVQKRTGRYQSQKQVSVACDQARKIGYQHIHFDLLYGLPGQNTASVAKSMPTAIELQPERISYQAYVYVPFNHAAQRLYTQADLPSQKDTLEIYKQGHDLLGQAGYQELGMDHLICPNDPLWLAQKEGRLAYNLMGYSLHQADLMIGLGVSAVSQAANCYYQNQNILQKYQKQLQKNILCRGRSHLLSEDELGCHQIIQELINQRHTKLPEDVYQAILPQLQDLQAAGFVRYEGRDLQVLARGLPLLRNICMLVDLNLS